MKRNKFWLHRRSQQLNTSDMAPVTIPITIEIKILIDVQPLPPQPATPTVKFTVGPVSNKT